MDLRIGDRKFVKPHREHLKRYDMSHVVGVFLFESFLGFSPKQFGNMKFVICGE